MPKVEGTYPHSMDEEQVVVASREAVAKLLDSFEGTDVDIVDDGKDNVGFSCKSRGFNISGKVFIKENEINVVVNLPMLAMAFKGLVQAAMDKQIPKYLEADNETTQS
tara:strand:- start:74 stop:397 length:324 start_codon:yes stop_codon:yes gene_type:complete